ncbi:MAG: MMPL family transporter [Gemmatimonadales bacterium]
MPFFPRIRVIGLPAKALIRHRWWVVAAWAALAALFAPEAARVQQVLAVRGTSDPESESYRAAQLIRQAFPRPVAEYVAIVVHGPGRWTDRRFDAALDSIAATLSRRPYVTQVISARSLGESTIASRDRRTTFLIAALDPSVSDDPTRTPVPDLRAAVRDALNRLPGGGDFDVKVTGNLALDHDVRRISAEDTERGELRVLPLTLLVLVLAFGALVAAALPLVVGVLAITIALGLVTEAAQFHTMSVFVLTITTMVGLGVGIDYSLLVVTRFREELNRGLAPPDAAIRTIQTAGSAVVTSGLTVVVGFAALVATPLIETRSVGIGGLLVVAVAVLLATTLLPAVLAVLGREIDRPRWLARPLARIHAPSGWERWARWLGQHPWHAIAIGGAVTLLLGFPLTRIRIGLPAANWFPPESESGQGLAALREMGVSGVLQPTRVVVQFPEGERAISARRLPGLKALADSLRRDPRVREVRSVATIRPGLSRLELAVYFSDSDGARRCCGSKGRPRRSSSSFPSWSSRRCSACRWITKCFC